MIMDGVTLRDPYLKVSGSVLATGAQAPLIAALALERLDQIARKKTRVFVSGYPGSPLAGTMSEGAKNTGLLTELGVDFFQANNEGAAVNFARGTQQIGARQQDKEDGITSIIVVKAPGLNQTWDYTTQGNADGSTANGGVVLVVGDDPAGLSTATWAKSEPMLQAAGLAVLAPSYVGEFAQYITIAAQLSRYAGCWAAVPVTSELGEDWGITDLDRLNNTHVVIPVDHKIPDGGLNFDPNHTRHDQGRLLPQRLAAAEAFVDANYLNYSPEGWRAETRPQLGIVAPGVSYAHVRQALYDLGINEEKAEQLGIRLLKTAAPTLISRQTAASFAKGLKEILVVEELHDLTEQNLRAKLYGQDGSYPSIIGRKDSDGKTLLIPEAHDPSIVALAIASRILSYREDSDIRTRAKYIERLVEETKKDAIFPRIPDVCPGCPHSLSTLSLEGSRNMGATSCSALKIKQLSHSDPRTETYPPMGGECGWVGEAPYSSISHAVQLMGDGTFFHSGLLAIRSAMHAYKMGLPINMTYEILYNGVIAMTGGQGLPNHAGPVEIAQELHATGVKDIVIATNGDKSYRRAMKRRLSEVLPRGFEVKIVEYHQIQAEKLRLREAEGITGLIADKACATENRRARARGISEAPDTRVYINEDACEGCGDCSTTSGGCSAVQFVQTELGSKSQVNPTICNVDLSCLKGFCPALNQVQGKLRRFDPQQLMRDANIRLLELGKPEASALNDHYGVLTPGIGGQGPTLVGRILGWATYIQNQGQNEQLTCVGHDAAGLAQKGGPVASYYVLGTENSKGMHASRISAGNANLVLACDAIHAAAPGMLSKIGPDTIVIANTGIDPVIQAKRNAALRFRDQEILDKIKENTADGQFLAFNASAVSQALTGSALGANMVMLGYAFQLGLIPLKQESITAAITLNGAAVEQNLMAFEWGRRCAQQPEIADALSKVVTPERLLAKTLDEKIEIRAKLLEAFQDAAYADYYRTTVERVREKDIELGRTENQRLTAAVAEGLFHVMYSKDEFEVARLYLQDNFREGLDKQFEPGYKVTHRLAPPVLQGFLKGKIPVPESVARPLFKTLVWMKGVRGKWYNPFDFAHLSEDRNLDRRLLRNYKSFVEDMLSKVSNDTGVYVKAVNAARRPLEIVGYGRMRSANAAKVPIAPEFQIA